MTLIRKAIKISVAAKMLGISMSSIRERKAGTASLTLFKRPGCRLWFTYESEVNRILQQEIVLGRKGINKK